MRIVGMIAWVVTALAAIAIGLMPLGYRVFENQWFVANPAAVNVLQYIIGILGVLSLVMFFASCFGSGCACCHDHVGGHKDHHHKNL